MALTLEQEKALLGLLQEKRITLPDLTAATEVIGNDLFLVNQMLADKSVTADVMKQFLAPDASLTRKGLVQLSNNTDSDNETMAVTPRAVNQAIQRHSELRQHPDASLTQKGLTQLSNSTDSNDEVTATTPKAVNQAIQRHAESNQHPDASLTQKGLVQLSNNTDSDNETMAVTPRAVNQAIQKHADSRQHPDASLTQKGLVQLSNSTDSNNETTAVTPKAVNQVIQKHADSFEGRLSIVENTAQTLIVDVADRYTKVETVNLIDNAKTEINSAIKNGIVTDKLTVNGKEPVFTVNGVGADENGNIEINVLPPLEHGVVGSDIFGGSMDNRVLVRYGDIVNGSELVAMGISSQAGEGNGGLVVGSLALPGAWLCLGILFGWNTSGYKSATLFRRVA